MSGGPGYNRAMPTPRTLPRRDLLALAALLAATPGAIHARAATAPAIGRPGDFDFLTGTWRIHHRRPKADGSWDEFDGEATCWSVLGGSGHIEELRIPARDFSGLGIRLLDPTNSRWNDVWVNGKARVRAGTDRSLRGRRRYLYGERNRGWCHDDRARRLGPHHADVASLASGRVERRRPELDRGLVHDLDPRAVAPRAAAGRSR
jgi:hypothetical protein